MLESNNIQSRGFQNVYSGNKITGFQIKVKTSYYRGVFLSQFRPVDPGPFVVKVDGEEFKGDQITLTIEGKTYQQKNFQSLSKVYWPIDELALLTISKPGGLQAGTHDVEVSWSYSQCYEVEDATQSYKEKRVLIQ
jgi:hypothetical protein